jgi:uncharacterized protein YbjT (DUF2867 family)
MSDPIKVCVAGATGHLGLAVVEELLARRMAVVAIARNASSPQVQRLRELGAMMLEFVDASKPEERFEKAVSGATACVSCMAARMPGGDFWDIDRDANIRWGLEALKAGAQHLLIVSTFEGQESRKESAFSNAKEEAVETLRRACQDHNTELTVIRPNAYFKDLTDRAFDRVLTQGEHIVIGDGTFRINPIAREDVAVSIADCIEKKNPPGKDYFLGGPDIFTFRDIGILAAQVMGKEDELRVHHVSLLYIRLLVMILDLFGLCFRSARRKAALFHWMIYASLHDAVAPCCGKLRLRDEFEKKSKAIDGNHSQNK